MIIIGTEKEIDAMPADQVYRANVILVESVITNSLRVAKADRFPCFVGVVFQTRGEALEAVL